MPDNTCDSCREPLSDDRYSCEVCAGIYCPECGVDHRKEYSDA